MITVRFVCGYLATTAATAVPESLKAAMLLLVGEWFEQRSASPTTMNSRAYDALIDKWRTGDEFHTYGRSIEYS